MCSITARCWCRCWIFLLMLICDYASPSSCQPPLMLPYLCTYISKLSSQCSECFNTKCVNWCDLGLRRMKMSIKESKQFFKLISYG